MTRFAVMFGLLLTAAACDGGPDRRVPLPATPTLIPEPAPTPSPSPPPPPVIRSIALGEEVKDVFLGSERIFELTAPASGVLVARLNWDVWYNGSLLVLGLGEAKFKGSPPAWAPVIGRLQVTSGQTYRLTVSEGGTDWFYDDPFVLTTSME